MKLRAVALSFTAALAIAACSSPPATTSNNVTATDTPFATQHSSRHRHHRHRGSNESPEADVSPAASVAGAQASGGGSAYPCDDRQFLTDQQEFSSGRLNGDQAVDVCGSVTRVLPARTTRSGAHGYYYIQVASGVTIEIVCNLDEMNAPAWPWVAVGNYSYAQGRYYYDSSGTQGIDWTHHGSSRAWPTPGYVVVDGKEYS